MEALTSWASSHGAELHPAVEVFNDNDTGNSFRVRVGQQLSPGETIATCPFSLTLSYLNTLDLKAHGYESHDDAQPLPREFVENIPPHVVARFFLMKQYLLGRDSFWYPYICTLPQPDQLSSWSLPPLWPSDDIELLEDTNIHTAVAEIKARLKAEYKQATPLLAALPNANDYTRLLYNWAYSIFTSRSFRPSRVVPDHESLPLPEGCAIDDFHILMPLFDIGNHSHSAGISWDIAPGTSTTVLKTLDAYESGAQVFNNYGSKTNAELMLAYGFLIPESPTLHNDFVHLQLRTADETASSLADSAKPRSFFFSLRPVADPSSLAAHRQLTLPNIDPASVLPAFRHVQDALIWQLFLLQTTPEQRNTINVPSDAKDSDEERLKAVLTGKLPDEFTPILEQTMAIIQAKAMQELEKLEQSDFELDKDTNATRIQRMVYQYRTQCRQVLINVLESVEPPPE
ncbi:hypothetical protein VDGD_03779 [Verticillium dahliae]|nr:hypothetical protein VdG1_08469 [Verticillium dahliae VDG1]RBQ81026.1 hypothetical protein VDGD_03779 [Verticillium dahliae]